MGISDKLNELLKKAKISPEKLADLTEIPTRFINSLLNEEFNKLPSEPYVRGYLGKIAKILKVNSEELISIYKDSTPTKRSGEKDKLPSNRFKKIKFSKISVIAIVFIILIASFLMFRLDEILGLASLEVDVPQTTTEEVLGITGSVKPGDTLRLNEEVIYTDENGRFEKEISLEPGLNTLEFEVKRFLGREKTVIKQVYYEEIEDVDDVPPEGETSPFEGETSPTPNNIFGEPNPSLNENFGEPSPQGF